METDLSILEKVKNGDLNAFSELVLRHQKNLLRLALRVVRDLEVAEDVVQESFIKAYQKLHTFEGRASFRSWIFQIALNTAKNKLRARRTETLDMDDVNLAVESRAEGDMIQADLKRAVQAEVAKLPTKQRTALSLRIFDDLSFAEIADIMNCPYDTAKANYRHAILKLRTTFAESHALQNWVPKRQKRLAEVDL